MDLKVDKIFCAGVAQGCDLSGKEYYILNGDLYLGKIISVDLISGNFAQLPSCNYNLDELIKEYGDKNGLIFTNQIREIEISRTNDRIFELGKFWVFPDKKISQEVELLIQTKELWHCARIKISNNSRQKIVSRLPIFGLDFERAIKKVISSGKEISHFYCPNKKDFQNEGSFADFLVVLNKSKNGVINLQCWQAVENGSEIFFAHGEIDSDGEFFNHFDCAIHQVSFEQIIKLFKEKQRIEIIEKEKYFRLDGRIDKEHCFKLMKLFFPIDKLVDEYYCESDIN